MTRRRSDRESRLRIYQSEEDLSRENIFREKFVFESYEFDRENFVAKFHYSLENYNFVEEIQFAKPENSSAFARRPLAALIDEKLLDSALFLAHILVGTSYYKTFPTHEIEIRSGKIDPWQAEFFNAVFQEGLSQFAYENDLTRENLAHFTAGTKLRETARNYNGQGILALQSGGKDSLLVAELLQENHDEFETLYFSSRKSREQNRENYPQVLNELGTKINVATRQIDCENLAKAAENGALNGHIPITYILQSLAIIQAILFNKNQILTAVAHEGEEPREEIDGLKINHQWSKTWRAETDFQNYVAKYISPGIEIGSPLRQFSELAVAELFVAKCWKKFGRKFSSCNVANYKQNAKNSELKWCGECAKCANSWLLFAPFVSAKDLRETFGVREDLFANVDLAETFKGLLDVDGVPKPFECVGEIAELRRAYHLAQKNGFAKLNFHVPKSDFDYHAKYEHNGDLVI